MSTYLKIILAATAIIFSVSAYAVVRCGIDGHNMMWTGNTMVDAPTSQILYEMKCINGHTAWSKSAN